MPGVTVTVTVTGTPPNGTYSSTPGSGVLPNGTITVNQGLSTIQFVNGSGSGSGSWQFLSPWITFNPPGPFTITSQDGSQITISDNDQVVGPDTAFAYTLYTTAGNFDPEIIDKGRPG
jgi:hypothetical protein